MSHPLLIDPTTDGALCRQGTTRQAQVSSDGQALGYRQIEGCRGDSQSGGLDVSELLICLNGPSGSPGRCMAPSVLLLAWWLVGISGTMVITETKDKGAIRPEE